MIIDFAGGEVETHDEEGANWTVRLRDAGHDTNTGDRIKRLEPWSKDGTFMANYGDGVSNVDPKDLLRFHRSRGRTATAVRPPARFGGLTFDGDLASEFSGKMERLAVHDQLAAYRHGRFWRRMDTLRDKRLLKGLWRSGRAPWKVWD